jgi:hypothetical protein
VRLSFGLKLTASSSSESQVPRLHRSLVGIRSREFLVTIPNLETLPGRDIFPACYSREHLDFGLHSCANEVESRNE